MYHMLEEELLERLPEKSLCRFKSVSKEWKSMIESSYLAKKRLLRYPNPELFALRLETSKYLCTRTIFLETISKNHLNRNKILVYSYKFPEPHHQINNGLGRILGYCNGFVCIYDLGYIHLFNPATRKLRTLSPEFLREYTTRPGWSRDELPISVGFGRDIITGEYKVILMYLFEQTTLIKAEVFNLTNGERRYIYFPLFYDELRNDKISIFANGSLYWLTKLGSNAYNDQPAKLRLGAIDLHTEKFRDVLLPNGYTKYSESVYLWNLRDCLCISDVLQHPYMDVWGLQHEDPSAKWEKIRSINMFSMDCLESHFWKLGLLACSFGSSPTNNFLKQVRDEPSRTVLYTENLVSSV